MSKVKVLDFEVREILNKIMEGKTIYRMNVEQCSVINLADRTIKQIIKNEKEWPEKYIYFEVLEVAKR